MKYIAIMLLALTTIGCATTDTITLNKMPRVSEAEVIIVPHERVKEEMDKYPNVQFPTLVDEVYVAVSPEYARKLSDSMLTMAWKIGFKFTANSGDCDDYSKMYASLGNLAMALSRIKASLLAFPLVVKTEHDFGGIKGGGWHSPILIWTTDGPYVLEGQSSVITPLNKYLDKLNIRYLL